MRSSTSADARRGAARRDRRSRPCPTTSRSGTRSSRSARGSTCGRTSVPAGCCRGSRPRSRARARRRRHPRSCARTPTASTRTPVPHVSCSLVPEAGASRLSAPPWLGVRARAARCVRARRRHVAARRHERDEVERAALPATRSGTRWPRRSWATSPDVRYEARPRRRARGRACRATRSPSTSSSPRSFSGGILTDLAGADPGRDGAWRRALKSSLRLGRVGPSSPSTAGPLGIAAGRHRQSGRRDPETARSLMLMDLGQAEVVEV